MAPASFTLSVRGPFTCIRPPQNGHGSSAFTVELHVSELKSLAGRARDGRAARVARPRPGAKRICAGPRPSAAPPPPPRVGSVRAAFRAGGKEALGRRGGALEGGAQRGSARMHAAHGGIRASKTERRRAGGRPLGIAAGGPACGTVAEVARRAIYPRVIPEHDPAARVPGHERRGVDCEDPLDGLAVPMLNPSCSGVSTPPCREAGRTCAWRAWCALALWPLYGAPRQLGLGRARSPAFRAGHAGSGAASATHALAPEAAIPPISCSPLTGTLGGMQIRPAQSNRAPPRARTPGFCARSRGRTPFCAASTLGSNSRAR